MTLRLYLLTATIALGLATIVKALQVSLTPDPWAALAGAGTRLLASSGFGVLLFLTTITFTVYCLTRAFEQARKG